MNFSPAVQQELINTAKQAAALLLRYYKTDLIIEKKEDKSPVTEADHAANALIIAALKRLTPEIPVVAEESAETHRMDVSNVPAFWLVDPLDGTKSFIKHTDQFTVNMGLIHHGIPSWGVIAIPAQDMVGPKMAKYCASMRIICRKLFLYVHHPKMELPWWQANRIIPTKRMCF